MTQLDPKALRQAFGSFPTGVTVVTTIDETGQKYGFTANSFTSVSIDPPLLLVCPGKFLSSFEAFKTCKRFAVNILAEGQEEIANTFASFKGDRFAKVSWQADAHGDPLIDHAATQFSCATHQIIPAGDHIILIGEVEEFTRSDQRGLGYSSGRYFSLGLEREAAMPQPDTQNVAGVIVEQNGHVLLCKTPQGWHLPTLPIQAEVSARHAIAEHFAKHHFPISMGKAFSVFSDRTSATRYTYIQATTETSNPSSLGTFIPIEELAKTPLLSATETAILTRYALERVTGHFGLYVGNEQTGDIHIYDDRT